MKCICHVQVLPILSGVQRAMLEMFRHVDRQRFELHVACQGPGPLVDELRKLDIPCHFVPSLVRQINPILDLRAYSSLGRLFRRQRFHCVHTHSSKPGIVARVAARQAGVPWVIHHVHSFAFHQFSSRGANLVYPRLERWAGQYSHLVLFVNNEERELAIERQLLPAEKCVTIHNGVNLARFSDQERTHCREAFRARFDIAPDELLILFMGRIDVPKQPLILPEVVDRLDALVPDLRWKLLIAGSGPMETQLKHALAHCGALRRVILAGWQDPSHPAFHGADLVVQPSLWEGLPLSLVEAHAAGLPVVASNVKGIREVVTTKTGILCEPCDPQAYANALAHLIWNPQLRQQMGIAARGRAFDHFDGDINMKFVARLYEDHFYPDSQRRTIERRLAA
jgi:glycosyltransferase involved in cell wall biosynthesis